jgi:hypothetical protein
MHSHILSQLANLNRFLFISLAISVILIIVCSFSVHGENVSKQSNPTQLALIVPLNNSYPVDLNITINTTDYTIQDATNQNKKRINYLLSTMLDPKKGNMNISDISVSPYSISLINSTDVSLENIYNNRSVYLVSSTIHLNTTILDRTRLFRNTMPSLMHDQTLVKASYHATYERN